MRPPKRRGASTVVLVSRNTRYRPRWSYGPTGDAIAATHSASTFRWQQELPLQQTSRPLAEGHELLSSHASPSCEHVQVKSSSWPVRHQRKRKRLHGAATTAERLRVFHLQWQRSCFGGKRSFFDGGDS